MKRSWTALAVTFFALGVLAGCNDYNNSIQYDTGATITNLSPSVIAAGPPPSTAAQCQKNSTGPTFPCFTLFVSASAANPWSTNTGVPLPVARWNGTNLPTTFIDNRDISAQVPYSYVTSPGSVPIDVYQPTGQGTGYNGLSNALAFTIFGAPNPFPLLSSVSPTSAAYCDSTSAKCANVNITVTGQNFLPTSQNGGSSVTFTGPSTYNQETAITVTSITSTQMKATIPGTLLCASGAAQINVINPPSAVCLLNCPNLGGGDTNNPPSGQPQTTQTFTITNASPANTCPAYVPPSPTPAVAVDKPAISKDGRYVAYSSTQGGTAQVLLRDTCLGGAKSCVASTRILSASVEGTAGNGDSYSVTMTPDGRYVAFSSAANNLVANTPAGQQIYLRDTCNGAPESCKPSLQLISTNETGMLTGTDTILPSISATGRFVAFLAVTPSAASIVASAGSTNPVPAPQSMVRQIMVRDSCAGVTDCTPSTKRITSLTAPALVAGDAPAISQDSRYVAYTTSQGGIWQIVVSDTCLGVTGGCAPSRRTISAAADGSLGNGASHNAVMTSDGRYIAFSSAATNLVENVPLGRQVYLVDTCAGAKEPCKASTLLVSADAQGQLSGTGAILPSLSTSARFVAFVAVTPSEAGTATDTPNSGTRQVFLRDTCLGASDCTPKTVRISLQPGDAPITGIKQAGPALAGLAKEVVLPDGKTSTVFTPTVAIDDRVLLAVPSENK